jgi:hypothetical protein
MQGPNSLLTYYECIEKDNLAAIVYFQKDIARVGQLREDLSEDWEIEELTRSIMHDEAQIIQNLAEEVADAREAKNKLV